MTDHKHSHTNRLIDETSPYLLQHAHNPVDWYPWGQEAFERAKAENKPVLLSVGYSACHWCHVMERESFENETIAAQMNRDFVSIKVDREERPDVDSIYMDAVVAMTGQGGWPMTVFLTPEGVPFYGGTYFPPDRRHAGMPSFPEVLEAIADTYHERPEDVANNAEQLREALENGGRSQLPAGSSPLTPDFLNYAWYVEGLNQKEQPVRSGLSLLFDATEGGLGRAPKFPQPMTLDYVLRFWQRTKNAQAREMLELTLTKMARGGIYDQLGGGFHRYSTDKYWLAPHFEKMLYDNSQLSLLYLQAGLALHNDFYQQIAVETLDYVLREMTSPTGGFYSTQDADSEGEEGKFFVWSLAEIMKVLGEAEAKKFATYYDLSPRGNWEGHNILRVLRPLNEVAHELKLEPEELATSLATSRQKLFDWREKRIKPGRDEKVLVSWNGLMLKSFAVAARVLGREDYRAAALANAEFVLSTLRSADGRLIRTYKDGKAHLTAFLEDYAWYADGLLALYEATFDLKWLEEAQKLMDITLEYFWDEADGTFYDTPTYHEQLITRPRSLQDNATPSGNSVAAEVLLKLALITGNEKYAQTAEKIITRLGEVAAMNPAGFGRMLGALDFYFGTPAEIVIVGNEQENATQELLRVVYSNYLPNRVVMLINGTDEPATKYPLLEYRVQLEGKPTAYVCQNYACQQPVTTPAELAQQLGIEL